MRTLWNAYFSYDKDPVQTVRGLVENRRFGAAAAGYAAAALCWLVFFWTGAELTVWGLLWRFAFFWLLEMTLGYLWAALSGLFLNFFSGGNGPSALFVVMGLSGFVQGLLLCFALIAAAAPWLKPLAVLVLLFTLVLRLVFVVRNAARAAQVGAGKAFGALCFALVPVAAGVFLCAGAAGLFIAFLF